MKKVRLKNVVWKEGGSYVAWNINTSVSSFGDSRKEALSSLKEALELYFEDVPLSSAGEVSRPDIVPMEFRHA